RLRHLRLVRAAGPGRGVPARTHVDAVDEVVVTRTEDPTPALCVAHLGHVQVRAGLRRAAAADGLADRGARTEHARARARALDVGLACDRLRWVIVVVGIHSRGAVALHPPLPGPGVVDAGPGHLPRPGGQRLDVARRRGFRVLVTTRDDGGCGTSHDPT